ncbi:MAG: zinc ribbon domain-containing protein [Oscillospiraceae bacterium]|nr:zinc ribbon domain-containing protein [Oscillospiraceae bacterium]
MFCGQCGVQLEAEDRFCGGCGTAADPAPPAGSSRSVQRNHHRLIGVITCAVAVILAFALLSALCGSGNHLAGTWVNGTGDLCFVFNKDGSCFSTKNQTAIPSDAVYYQTSANNIIIFSDINHYPYDPVIYRILGSRLYLTGVGFMGNPGSREYEFIRR